MYLQEQQKLDDGREEEGFKSLSDESPSSWWSQKKKL